MSSDELRPLKRLADIDRTTLYTVDELAPLLKVTPRTLRKYCSEKVFANAMNLRCRRWLIPGADVLELCPGLNS